MRCLCRLQLAGDADTENEDGWEDDGAAPSLNDLPKLPQVVEALKAPWQRSGAPCHLSCVLTRICTTARCHLH
jgi:hypothetical protein